MDLLKRELERKKKALQSAKSEAAATVSGSDGRRRFYQVGTLRRLQQEKEEELKASSSQKKRKNQSSSSDDASKKRQRTSHSQDETAAKAHNDEKNTSTDKPDSQEQRKQESSTSAAAAAAAAVTGSSGNIASSSPSEITQKLRALGLAVRLFAEQDAARLERLQQALRQQQEQQATETEKDEFRLGQGHGIRNPFLEKQKSGEGRAAAASSSAAAPAAKKGDDDDNEGDDKQQQSAQEQVDDTTDDPHKRIYRYFKGLLREWEDDLTKRPDTVKRSVAGRNETKTLKQCKDYIRPLFKLCKNRKLDDGLVANILKIVDYCQAGEFVKAHDAYMDVAIGKAAWPIGVTQVGIHSRTGRSKIESQNVAHVMNSELQRKYLTSVKRLMTFAQRKRTDVDPSKKVMN